jgi:hypothetical protein
MIHWIETNLYIRPIGGGKVPFILNRFQRRLLALIVKRLKQGRPVRIVVLKSRQLGISTLTEAIIFYMVTHYPEWKAMVIAQQKGPARNLYRMTRRYYQNLPKEEKLPLRYGRAVPAQDHLEYADPHASELAVTTAQSEEVARSETLQGVHCSEHAFFRDPETVMTALEQAVHEVAGTIFIIESTANGLNLFKYYWDRAAQKDSIWERLFFSWTEDPANEIEPIPGQEVVLDEQEQEFMDRYGLTIPKILWARYKRDDKCHGSWEKFHQEYPVAPELAFLYSGFPIFDQKLLREQLELAQNLHPLYQGDLEFKSSTDPIVQETLPDPLGNLIMWKRPEAKRAYVSGADPSEGGGTKADYSANVVLDDESGEVVAEYESNNVRPTAYAIKCYQVGVYYRSGLMAIERNSIGQAVLGALEHGIDERRIDDPSKLKYPQLRRYPDLYYEVKWDEKTQKETKRMGFATSKHSKFRIIAQLAEAHKDGSFIPRSVRMIQQMQGLVWEDRGPGSGSRKRGYKQNFVDPRTKRDNDDLLMASAIAYDMRIHKFGRRFAPRPETDEWEGIAA